MRRGDLDRREGRHDTGPRMLIAAVVVFGAFNYVRAWSGPQYRFGATVGSSPPPSAPRARTPLRPPLLRLPLRQLANGQGLEDRHLCPLLILFSLGNLLLQIINKMLRAVVGQQLA
jgi:hypothetical protein